MKGIPSCWASGRWPAWLLGGKARLFCVRFVRYSRMKPSSVPEARGPVVLVRNGSLASAKG